MGRGTASTILDDAASAEILGLVDRMMPGAIEVLERAANELKANAVARWPVGAKVRQGVEKNRPHSRDQFETVLQIQEGPKIKASLVNSTDYWYLIKSDQNGLEGGSAYRILVSTPAKGMAVKVGADVAAVLAKLKKR